MSAVPRRKAATRNMMTVYPPRQVAVPLGGYRTKPLSAGIRIAAHLLSDASVSVAKKIASRKEWDFVYAAFDSREIEPEASRPGYHIADAVEQRHARFNDGTALDAKHPDKAVAALADKLRELTYLEAWVVLIAIRWRAEYDHETAGDGWWTLAYREKFEKENNPEDE